MASQAQVDGGGRNAAEPSVPSTAEGLLADRQVLWGDFTKLILWSIIGIIVILVLLDWMLL